MTIDWSSWGPLIAALTSAGALVGVLAVASLTPWVTRHLSNVAPATRSRLLLGLLTAPALAAVVMLSVAFTPSVLDGLGLLTDHCAHHVDHAFHLCFIHGVAPDASWPLVLLVPVLAVLLRAGMIEVSNALRTRRWARGLRNVARHDAELDCWLLDGDAMAFTIGTVQPEIFVSDSLRRELEPSEWTAILEHERAHRRRNDALVKTFARVAASLHPAAVRRQLLDELDLAVEQCCDEAAAAAVGRTAVATAIVAMARRRRNVGLPTFVEAFDTHPVERRVRALLDHRWVQFPRWMGAVLAGAPLVVLALAHERLHHSLETAVTYLF